MGARTDGPGELSQATSLLLTRRRLLAGIVASAATASVTGAQQAESVQRVGYLHEAPGDFALPPLARALANLGYVEGQNVAMISRWVRGSQRSPRGLTEELLAARVNVIVAAGDPAVRGAREATTTVPIVMAPASFAEERGFIKSHARPGGNVTGIVFESAHDVSVQLELLRRIVPTARTVAFLTVAGGDEVERAVVERMASTLGVRVVTVMAQSGQLETAFVTAKGEGADALLVGREPRLFVTRRNLVELAETYRLPAVWELWPMGIDGALLSYGPRLPDLPARVASFVDRIVKGANPGDLPVEQPTKHELVINLRTAKALGLTIPDSLRLSADHLVE